MFNNKINEGFTLIELLVVIAIISILSSVVFASLSGAKARARDSERISEVGEIALALELYYNSCKEYPASLVTTANNGCPTGITLGTFMNSIPTPPDGGSYDYFENNGKYVVRAELEENNRALANDVDGATPVTGCSSCSCEDSPNYYYCKGN